MRRLIVVLGAAAAATAAALTIVASAGPPAGRDASPPPDAGLSWSTAAPLTTCGAARAPHVVFPQSAPNQVTGTGAIVWLGLACATGATTLDAAPLDSDTPAPPRSLTSVPLARFDALAATTRGQLVAVAGAEGIPRLGEGFTAQGFPKLDELAGSDVLAATQTGFIGDVDVATVAGDDIVIRAQRHYMRHFGRAVTILAGSKPPTALAIGMDYRADRLIVWDEQGEIYARYITNDSHVKQLQRLGPAGYAPQISTVLSDDDRAFVIWTDEPPPGDPGTARVLVAHSAVGPRFHGAQTLASFAESATARLPFGAVAAERLSSEGVALLWPAMAATGDLTLDAAGARAGGVLAPNVIVLAGHDVHLGAVATGPLNELVAVLEVTTHDSPSQALYAVRSNVLRDPGGLGFGALTQLAPAGQNTLPAIAVDPATDAAIAAWQTPAGIDWARGIAR